MCVSKSKRVCNSWLHYFIISLRVGITVARVNSLRQKHQSTYTDWLLKSEGKHMVDYIVFVYFQKRFFWCYMPVETLIAFKLMILIKMWKHVAKRVPYINSIIWKVFIKIISGLKSIIARSEHKIELWRWLYRLHFRGGP